MNEVNTKLSEYDTIMNEVNTKLNKNKNRILNGYEGENSGVRSIKAMLI